MATKTAIKVTFTDAQKATALSNARKSLVARRSYAKNVRSNSFDEWGNDKCISRTIDTINAMQSGHPTAAQYRYWLNH